MTKLFKTMRLKASDSAIRVAKELILSGEVVAVPTETVYGLAADATSESAIAKIYAAKGRPSFNPLIVHVGRDCGTCDRLISRSLVDGGRLSEAARHVSDSLMAQFWPGPLTIVLPRGSALPSKVAGGLSTVGFRMPRHPSFLDLIEATDRPLAAPSANRSNRISPTTAEHVLEELDGRIPLVLDGGPAQVGVESTIVAVNQDGSLTMLRPGGLPMEQIVASTGSQIMSHAGKVTAEPAAPGMLKLHYAPSKPLLLATPESAKQLVQKFKMIPQVSRLGILSFGTLGTTIKSLGLDESRFSVERVINFPPDDLLIANGLFAALRELDHSEIHAIIAELPSHRIGGLWPAICDRLNRGGSPYADKV